MSEITVTQGGIINVHTIDTETITADITVDTTMVVIIVDTAVTGAVIIHPVSVSIMDGNPYL
ncbi:hypothetical protein F1728_17960 [Gimesia benthica]|uniref:Uncharacterized protein n=1 Tax=Gimesia benthica TaxID=2608982 RepID=A0A6I6AH69_9PLAN|nr:hypothetical protein F1728_17960 [Gimesia benthica]